MIVHIIASAPDYINIMIVHIIASAPGYINIMIVQHNSISPRLHQHNDSAT